MMTNRQESLPLSSAPFGVASLVMFGLSYHEGRRVRQLKQAHSVSSVSEALSLAKLIPIVIAVRGKTGSVKPVQTDITPGPAVMIADTLEMKRKMRSTSAESIWGNAIFRRYWTEPDWFITDGTSQLAVESCANARHLEKTLVTSKRFMLCEGGTIKTSKNQTRDVPHVGVWRTERSLLVGTTVTIVGELANSSTEDGTIVIREPSKLSKGAPFYITTQTFDQLRRLFKRTSRTYKWLGIGFGAVSLILTGINVWKDIRSIIQYRRVRNRIAENRELNEQMKNEMKKPSDVNLCQTHFGKCVNNKVDAVFIPCGHLCACMTCSEKLKTCPVCRSLCKSHKLCIA